MALILVNQIGIRDRELTCNPDFSRMLATELVRWARETYHLTDDPVVDGLNGRSFGGSCSAYTALQHSDVFGIAFMQSGSCWMHPSVLGGHADSRGTLAPLPVGEGAQVPSIIAAYQAADPVPVRICQECGTVDNGLPPARIWQTFGNRWFHDSLELKGYDTVYRDFAGGHDDAWWRGTFADGSIWLYCDRSECSVKYRTRHMFASGASFRLLDAAWSKRLRRDAGRMDSRRSPEAVACFLEEMTGARSQQADPCVVRPRFTSWPRPQVNRLSPMDGATTIN